MSTSPSSAISRSVYLSHIRRAFLLRVHPDRFRNHTDLVRVKQASLVKALAERLSQPDFTAWQQGQQNEPISTDSSNNSINKNDLYSFILERRDGLFLRKSIQLSPSTSVESILQSMAQSLQSAGAASLPLPPTDISNHQRPENLSQQTKTPVSTTSTGTSMNYKFDIISQRGRDLWKFLSNLSHEDVRQRKSSRTDAQAAALVVRRLYQFQAVDATTLGWSSASVAVLLRRLVVFHEEHLSKLHVTSFYPCRLYFTSDDFQNAFDVHGGVLRLDPASTPLQWLEAFQLVTEEKLNVVKYYRTSLVEKTKLVQSLLGVQIKKGHSCSSREYYDFLSRLCPMLPDWNESETSLSVIPSEEAGDVTLEPAVVTVESSQLFNRRPFVTKEGSIRLGSTTSESQIRQVISRLALKARKQAFEFKQEQEKCKDTIQSIQWQFGLERVFQVGVGVSNSQFLDCLVRLLRVNAEQMRHIEAALGGKSLGIACKGTFCHLADDGSVVIPYDWK